MSRPWIVRSVALLLVLVGLQAGSFQDLDAGHERNYTTQDYNAAVRPETRKSDPAPSLGAAADVHQAPPALHAAPTAPPPSRGRGIASLPQHLLPAPTGPPRA